MQERRLMLMLIMVVILLLVLSCSDKTTESENQVSKPTFSPEGGSFSSPQNVTINCETAGALIRYTTCGEDPTTDSQVYEQPIRINMTTTLKARAYKDGFTESDVTTASYTVEADERPQTVRVEGGTFEPSDLENYTVTLSSYYIGKYPVTQLEYFSVMGVNYSECRDRPYNPVEMVSWFDAVEYCNRLSIQEGLTPCYSYSDHGTDPDNWPDDWNTDRENHLLVSCDWSAEGYRLPTEMEWMFAAMGGNQSEGYEYSGSNNVDEVAWHLDNSDTGEGRQTHPVGSKEPNELGLYDMSGNVWEWNWDIHSTMYPVGSYEDPRGPEEGRTRVRRGGSWMHYYLSCNVGFRNNSFPSYMSGYVGFRVATSSE